VRVNGNNVEKFYKDLVPVGCALLELKRYQAINRALNADIDLSASLRFSFSSKVRPGAEADIDGADCKFKIYEPKTPQMEYPILQPRGQIGAVQKAVHH